MYYIYFTESPRFICTDFLRSSESVKRKCSVIYLKLLKLLITLHKASVFLNSVVRAGDNSVYRFAKINHIDADKYCC
jgi:hypothetical protein